MKRKHDSDCRDRPKKLLSDLSEFMHIAYYDFEEMHCLIKSGSFSYLEPLKGKLASCV